MTELGAMLERQAEDAGRLDCCCASDPVLLLYK